jgi:ubiquinone/menaquinone biosynthesis C-methylase UbiE
MELLNLIIDFHKDALRQGPGSEKETERALGFIDNLDDQSKMIDIGCGTGAQTMTLAKNTTGKIIAVDLLPAFLEKLNQKIWEQDLIDRVSTECRSMLELPYPDHEFDLIWAEGSIYHIGFAKGLKEWGRLLKPGGLLLAKYHGLPPPALLKSSNIGTSIMQRSIRFPTKLPRLKPMAMCRWLILSFPSIVGLIIITGRSWTGRKAF